MIDTATSNLELDAITPNSEEENPVRNLRALQQRNYYAL